MYYFLYHICLVWHIKGNKRALGSFNVHIVAIQLDDVNIIYCDKNINEMKGLLFLKLIKKYPTERYSKNF
jgi:hypothetical protein